MKKYQIVIAVLFVGVTFGVHIAQATVPYIPPEPLTAKQIQEYIIKVDDSIAAINTFLATKGNTIPYRWKRVREFNDINDQLAQIKSLLNENNTAEASQKVEYLTYSIRTFWDHNQSATNGSIIYLNDIEHNFYPWYKNAMWQVINPIMEFWQIILAILLLIIVVMTRCFKYR